jgi:branched-chain amino acid transport system permease protein
MNLKTGTIPNPLNRKTSRGLRPGAYGQHQYLTVVAVIGLIAILVPLIITDDATEYRVNLWLVYAMAGLGFYWIFGLGGRFAFCQTFMMALGSYMSAWVTRELGEGWFLLGLVAAMAAGAVMAGVIGLITARAQEFYFAIATLAVTEIGLVVFQKGNSFFGPNGTITNISIPNVFGHEIISNRDTFWLFLIILTILLFVGVLIERSPLRRNAIAARDNGPVAKTLGIGVIPMQLGLFMIGSAVGALSGALIGHWNGVTEASSFGVQLSIGIFLMLLLGGLKSMWGPIIGAAFYVAIPQLLSGLDKYSTVIYGSLLLLVVILMPQGLVHALQWIGQRFVDLAKGMRRNSASTPPDGLTESVATEGTNHA